MNNTTNDNGIFKKKTGYTVVDNPVARDKKLSLKAKGLYLLIQSYITMPGIVLKKSSLLDMCAEGKKAFDSTWEELKNNGYLIVHMTPYNRSWKVEYELLDERQDGAHTIYHSSNGEVSKTNLTRARKQASPETEDEHYPHNGIYADGSNAEGIYADGIHAQGNNANGGNNNKPRNINPKEINPYVDKHQSINPNDGSDAIDEYKEYECIVKENIDYYRLMEDYDLEDLDGIVSVMLDNILCKHKTIKISGTDYPADVVKSRLLKLNSSHIEFVLESMSKTSTDIKNIRAYLLKALYSAPDTMGFHFAAKVNHDFKNETAPSTDNTANKYGMPSKDQLDRMTRLRAEMSNDEI